MLLVFSLLFKESKAAYSYICMEACFTAAKKTVIIENGFLHLSFAWHDLEVLKASVQSEKLSCKEAFREFGGHGFLQCCASLVEKTKGLICCVRGSD